MKKVFAFVAMMGLLTFGVNQTINAQEEAPAIEEVAQDDSVAVDLRKAEENNTLDAESKTENHSDSNKSHEACTTLDELDLDSLVKTLGSIILFCNSVFSFNIFSSSE